MHNWTSFRCVFLFVLISQMGRTQSHPIPKDSLAHLHTIVLCSDSLKETGAYQAAVYQLQRWLGHQPTEEAIDRLHFDHSDTLMSVENQLPYALFPAESMLYWKQDSSAFSGYILRNGIRGNITEAQLFQEGHLIETHLFVVNWGTCKQGEHVPPFPFPKAIQQGGLVPIYWTHNLQRKHQVVSFTMTGDTNKISYYYSNPNYFEQIDLSKSGDTLQHEVHISFENTHITRGYSFEWKKRLTYFESTKLPNNLVNLTLWQNGDTLNFDQYVNNRQHGLQVIGENPDLPEKVTFRLLWEDGHVIDILNTNILFLKRNLKPVSAKKHLEKFPIDENRRNQLYLRSEEMIRLDSDGKMRIVIPHNVKNYTRFVRKLNDSQWRPLFELEYE